MATNRDCGHPNHGADDHDCGAFVGDRLLQSGDGSKARGRCSRCGGNDQPKTLSKHFACRTCGPRLLCYGCDVTHGTWCESVAA